MLRTGTVPDGRYYVAMEFVPGQTLGEMIQRQEVFEWHEAARLVLQLANAVAKLHERGVVHADIKPDNLMVWRTEDGLVRVKIIDFGLARSMTAEDPGSSIFGTAAGGTPRYMAPEIAQGQPASFQSDVYSLGVVLYELLTGETVFGQEGLQAVQAEAYLANGARDIPKVPVMAVDPEVPASVARVVHQCLCRAPEMRHLHAGALKDDLARLELPPLPLPANGVTAATVVARLIERLRSGR